MITSSQELSSPQSLPCVNSSVSSEAREKRTLRREMFLNMSPGFGCMPFSCQDPTLSQL